MDDPLYMIRPQWNQICALFDVIYDSEHEESQRYCKCKDAWDNFSWFDDGVLPVCLFNERAISRDILSAVAVWKVEMRKGEKEDGIFETLESNLSKELRSAEEKVQWATDCINSRCDLLGVPRVMNAAPDTSSHRSDNAMVFPITVHFSPCPRDEDEVFSALRNDLAAFERVYILYCRLNAAYYWTFDEGKLNHARNTVDLDSILLEDDCIELYRKLLLGVISAWVMDNTCCWEPLCGDREWIWCHAL